MVCSLILTQLEEIWKTSSFFFFKGRRPQQKIKQPKTNKSKDNGCGTAQGKLVIDQFILLRVIEDTNFKQEVSTEHTSQGLSSG